MSEPDPNALVPAVQELAERVHGLAERVALSQQAQREIKAHQTEIQAQAVQQGLNVAAIAEGNKRQGRWIKVQTAVIVALLAGGVVLWNVAVTANHATDAVQSTAVKSCQNTNEARKGTLRLWLGIINAPRPQGSPTRTEAQEQQIADLRQFVEQLFQPRDCHNLDRTYPLPELPDSLKPRSE